MQTSSQPKLLPVPFADAGSKQNIPNDSQIGITAGRASYTDGFPPLTRTPLAAGGVPPFGTDFNGVLNDITAALRWSQAGAGYPFDATFSTAITGFPKGARIPNSTYDGFWLNTTDGNTANPENTTSALTGWVPSGFYGTTAISELSGSSVTLTTLQAGRERITLAGTLTANINLFVPAWIKRWEIVNNCSGVFSVTVKTLSGTGVSIPAGLTAVVLGNGTNIIQDSSILGVPGRLLNIQYITSTGTYTKTPGTMKADVTAVGAGGGGGFAISSSSYNAAGGGGGAGGSSRQLLDVSSITSVPCTVGIGGKGAVASTQTAALAGGQTTFGTYLSAAGGTGGGGAIATTAAISTAVGGRGGTGSLGSLNSSGGAGLPGVSSNPAAGSSVGVGYGGQSIFSGTPGYGSGGNAGFTAGGSQSVNGNDGNGGVIFIMEYA